MLDTGVPRQLPDGTFKGYIGSCVDIADRKTMEEALQANDAKLRATNQEIRHLAGRLITAQKEERSRIARELHDDIGQQIALLTIELALLSRASQNEAARLTGEASRRAKGLARSVHDLSHGLHPNRLRLLGLVSALEALRNEFPECEMEIEFAHENIPSTLPADVTLCLFRIVQEGLQNSDNTAGSGFITKPARRD
jgi:signal transduction histidine kinase